MKQILVTVDTTKTQKQQAFVKESLTRALQEVKLAKLEGRKLPDARNLLKDTECYKDYGLPRKGF